VIISIANQKGGVGKTKSSYMLGNLLAEKNKTLMVDLDQGNLTDLFGIEHDINLYDMFLNKANIKEAIVMINNNLFLIPADIRMASLDRQLINKIRPDSFLSKELSKDMFKEFKYIVIDCPPSLDLRLVNALTASDYCIIAVQTEPHSFKAIPYMLEIIQEVKENTNPKIDYRFLATMHDKRTHIARGILETLQEAYKNKVFKTVIHKDNKMRVQAITKKIALTARATEEYRELVKEITHMREQ
jgi:chromosome partitioning protein